MALVFIRKALDLLINRKDNSKPSPQQLEAVQAAQAILQRAIASEQDLRDIFKPFQIASTGTNKDIQELSVDCLAKLFTYNFWDQPTIERDYALKTLIIDTVCEVFSGPDTTDERVQTHVINVLNFLT